VGGPAGSFIVALLVPIALATAPAFGQDAELRGADVFEAVCAGCHAAGEKGAPRIGDRAAWSQRAGRGLAGLTQSALDGIRNMPPHGGDTSLSDLELRRAIVYMINKSGGDWIEPAAPEQPAAGRSVAQIVQSYCALCHATGYGGAPRIGDRAAWLPRTALGIDPLVRKVVRGHDKMPPRGGQANLTDAELRDAVIYMISSASARGAADSRP